MSFLEEFQSNLESLPNILQRKYALLRDLDKSLQEIQRQNEQHCEEEIENYKSGVRSGAIMPESSVVRFSDDAVDEQKHAVRIADEKVALAVQAYDLVDAHIQQLDQHMKKFNQELQRERDNSAATGSPASTLDGSVKPGRSESGRGGRKKTRLIAAAAGPSPMAANPSSMDLDLPVDPNEPTYCLCNQVSYGDMVACDNPDCKIEWFHFGCVGLKEQPKGKWYCSDCVGMQKRKKGNDICTYCSYQTSSAFGLGPFDHMLMAAAVSQNKEEYHNLSEPHLFLLQVHKSSSIYSLATLYRHFHLNILEIVFDIFI